ncbi:uncharacterized protein LOC6601760 [Drosophila persimilis]|uniref:uncharacterized protein LOC6601760 n=1 Tax=Drosophila persimilis TaxID=7234 RepID=UPI000F084E56|nr:uncharacterized protein LOC6601760 [Drosophila persimilis]
MDDAERGGGGLLLLLPPPPPRGDAGSEDGAVDATDADTADNDEGVGDDDADDANEPKPNSAVAPPRTTAACPIDLSSSSDSRKSKTANTREREATLGESRSRLHRIGSLLTLAVLMYQLQQFAHPGSGGIEAAPTPSPLLNATYLAPPPDLLKRLQKRHNLGNFRQRFQRELNGSITRVDWENTCGGNWTGPEDWVRPAKRCKKRQLVIHALQNHTRSELRSLRAENKDTATTKAIDISQQRKWALHSGTYKFLPRLNASSHQKTFHPHTSHIS